MKKLLLFSLLLLGVNFAGAQDLTFDYDPAGNQIYRGPDTQSSSSARLASEDTLIKTTETPPIEEQEELIEIAAAPNPTSGVIAIHWKNTKEHFFVAMSLHTYSNSVLANKELGQGTSNFRIDLSSYPPGVYIAVFTTNLGAKQPYRIIKK